MLKQEIIEKISKYFKLTTFEAEKIYDDIFAGIIEGVKNDNFADIENLGEFIKKNNPADNSNTVEFLPNSALEVDLNQKPYDALSSINEFKSSNETETKPDLSENIPNNQNVVSADNESSKETKIYMPPAVDTTDSSNSYEEFTPEMQDNSAGISNIDDDIRKKREEILNKIKGTTEDTQIITPLADEIKQTSDNIQSDYEDLKEKSFSDMFSEIKPIEESKPLEEINSTAEEINSTTEEINSTAEEIKSTTEEIISQDKLSESVESVNDEKQTFAESAGMFAAGSILSSSFQDTKPDINIPETSSQSVIPPSAVELHNELISEQKASNITTEFPSVTQSQMPVAGNGNGMAADLYEHKNQDNSYYIWYKDSEPNIQDTQTMSYEYELLYQATKEAEYKSKLRVYVTTFILFFSIVLILLIFSPVIYRYFFTPPDEQNSEEIQDQGINTNENVNQNTASNENNNTSASNNQAQLNTLETPQQNQNQQTAPPPQQNQQSQPNNNQNQQTAEQQPNQEQQSKQEQQSQPNSQKETNSAGNKTESTQPPTQQSSPQNIPGVTKSSMGWMDEQNKVIYIQLENGKFTIQESAWDSDAKANKRISTLASLIPGLKGSVVAADLGSKGTWYRARIGEFSTLEEAKKTAEQLRNKEKGKLQALIYSFFWVA